MFTCFKFDSNQEFEEACYLLLYFGDSFCAPAAVGICVHVCVIFFVLLGTPRTAAAPLNPGGGQGGFPWLRTLINYFYIYF